MLDLLESVGADPRMSAGWVVDALVMAQTREHRDLDLAVRAEALDDARVVVRQDGFEVTTDWLPVRVELSRGDCHVDLHPLNYRLDGSAWQAGLNDTTFEYPAEDWVDGQIGGRAVRSLSVNGQRLFHHGYEHSDTDRHDLAVLQRHLQQH